MTNQEHDFLCDIKNVMSDYDYSYNYYCEDQYGDRYFCVDVTVSMEDWEQCCDEIWNDLEEVADDWGAGLDSDVNYYYFALEKD